MSTHDNDVIERLHALADTFEMPISPIADDVHRGRRRVRRHRGAVLGAAAAVVAVALGVTALAGGKDTAAPEKIDRPGLVVGAVPVWYDAEGLHHGDEVEGVPAQIVQPEQVVDEKEGLIQPAQGALALVRTGALYRDVATDFVWFHPWGDEPRVVGRDSSSGPGGDPDSDIAVWFEGADPMNGTPGELVVYDTAARRELSRTEQAQGVGNCSGSCGDHYPMGNGFLDVTPERVVWTLFGRTLSFDIATQTTTVIKQRDTFSPDFHEGVEVIVERDTQELLLRAPGFGERRYPSLETHLRVSPSGHYVLAVEDTEARHGASIVDTRTGEVWPVPDDTYPWIAWSYGDIALVDVEDGVLACDAAARTCEELEVDETTFLMPTS